MNTDRLTEAMTEIADDKIIRAHEPIVIRKKKSSAWIKNAGIAVAACLAVVLFLSVIKKPNGSVVYAGAFDQGELLQSGTNLKVTISDSITKLNQDTLVRLAIAIHEDYSAYPEIGFSWNKEGVSWDDYLSFCDYVVEDEMSFLEDNGAEDIERLGRTVIACTMHVRDIAKLDNDKNTYTVVMFTAENSDYKEGGSLDINLMGGEYKCVCLASISGFSSFYPPEEFIQSGRLTIKDGRATLEFTNSQDSDFYHILCNDCECVLVENTEFSNLLSLSDDSVIFNELKYSAHSTYELKGAGRAVKLYLTDGGKVYIDLGSWGIYLFY